MTRFTTPLAMASLALLTACGGGSNPASTPAVLATTLVYSNPATSGFSMQADPATNGTAHLVLNLVGPADLQVQGVSFFLSCEPTQATWSKGSGTPAYASNGTVFTLGAGPQPFLTQLSGGDLQVGIYHTSGVQTLASASLVRVALDLNTSSNLTQGTPVNLTVTTGRKAVYVDPNGVVQTFAAPIAIGTLTAH